MKQPFGYFARNLYLTSYVALGLAGATIGKLLCIPVAVYLLFIGQLSSSLTPETFAYWLGMALLVSAVAKLLGWMLELAAFGHTDASGTKVFPVDADGTPRISYVSTICSLLFASMLLARRAKLDEFMQGSAWLPIVIILLVAIEAWLIFAPTILGYRKQPLQGEERARIVTGNTAEYKAQVKQAGNDAQGTVQKNIVEPAKPRYTFQSIHGMADLKRRLLDAGRPVVQRAKNSTEIPRNGILFNGDPGNGKTFIAEALAGELGVKFLVLDHGKAVSQWVGETPRNIARAFQQAREAGPCVLFLDEVDSFITSRDGAASQLAEGANIVNVLLTELVNIRSYPVLVIAATNRLNKLDPAAIREGRFDYKIEIPAPDEPARLGLLTASLANHVKGVPADPEAVMYAAQRWEGFSVKRIQAVGEEMPDYLKEHPAAKIGYDQLMGALRRLQGRKGKVPADTRSLEQLVLPKDTLDAVNLVANRIADPLRIERLGGSLPSGILFHGPAGTGKTAVARALAKKTGWAFISVAGPDLLRDMDKMEEIYREAKDIRPALIFIDEADDILRDRQYSNASALTNKLLTIMDGADGKVKDVVFIAATNNPDQIDPAMLRAGRFTEKVPFIAADFQSAVRIVQQWVTARKAQLADSVTPVMLGKLLEGQSPANIEGVMQYALNLAIDSQHGDQILIGLEHVGKAISVVAPE